MENGVLFTLLALTASFVVAALIGYRKSQDLTSFFLMNGQLTLGPLVGTLAATNFSLGNMVFLSLIWGYFFGLSGIFWLCVGFIIAALAYVRFTKSPQVRSYINDRNNSGSVHEYLEKSYASGESRYATKIRLAASLVTVTCLTIALTLELYLGALLLSPVVGVDTVTIFVTLTVIKCLYSALGGFFVVVVTDFIQGSLLIVAIILLFVFAGSLNLPLHSYSEIHSPDIWGFLYAPGWAGILSIIGVTAGWYLVTMDTWQRACAARRAETAAQGMIIGTGLLLTGIVLLGLFGIYDHLALSYAPEAQGGAFSQGLNPISDLYLFRDRFGGIAQFFLGLLGIGFFAAALSTANTFLIVSGHSIISDLLVGRGRHVSIAQLGDRESRFLTGIARATIVLLGAFVIAMYFLLEWLGILGNPLGLFYLAYSIQFALLAPVVASLWRRRPVAGGAYLALLIGVGAALAWGFGFVVAGHRGVTEWGGLTIDQLIYLAPIPPILLGFLVVALSPKEVQS